MGAVRSERHRQIHRGRHAGHPHLPLRGPRIHPRPSTRQYDVFKLRTRIGLASADLGRQFPEFEDPLDAVVTGLSAVTGRWRDTYTQEEYARARQLLRDFHVSYLEGKEMWRLSEGERTAC